MTYAILSLLHNYDNNFSCVVKSFVEVVRHLLTLPGVEGQFILSERFSQDSLENYFGQQRARGGRCDNPTVKTCIEAAQSLRVQKSFGLQPVRGNCNREEEAISN